MPECATITQSNVSWRWMTPADWTASRSEITRLYIIEKRSMSEVAMVMRRKHGLHATPRMYKDRIKKWGLRKNLHASDARRLVQLKLQMEKAGKQFACTMGGTKLDYARVERHLQRKGLGHVLEASESSLPSNIHLDKTVVPHPCLRSPQHTSAIEDTLHALRCWIDGNLEGGVWKPNAFGNVADNKAICSAYRFFSEGARSLDRKAEIQDSFRWFNLGFHSLKDALTEQNSNIVVCLLRLTLGRLKDSPQLSSMLWNYFADLSVIKFGSCHPLSRISQQMASGDLLAGGYGQLSLIAWFVAKTMERCLGICNIAVINSYSQWSNMARLANTHPQKEDGGLKKLLERLEQEEDDSDRAIACRATLQIDLAWMLYDHREFSEVKSILGEVVSCPSISDYDLLRAYMLMGRTELALGNLRGAERCYRDRLKLNDAMWSELDSDSIRSLRDLVRVLTDLQDHVEVHRAGYELEQRLDKIERNQKVEFWEHHGGARLHWDDTHELPLLGPFPT